MLVILDGHGNGGLMNREGFWKEVTLYLDRQKILNFMAESLFNRKSLLAHCW